MRLGLFSIDQNIHHRGKMTALNSAYKDRLFLAVIGDEVQTLSPYLDFNSHFLAYPVAGLCDRFAVGWNRGMTRHTSKTCVV